MFHSPSSTCTLSADLLKCFPILNFPNKHQHKSQNYPSNTCRVVQNYLCTMFSFYQKWTFCLTPPIINYKVIKSVTLHYPSLETKAQNLSGFLLYSVMQILSYWWVPLNSHWKPFRSSAMIYIWKNYTSRSLEGGFDLNFLTAPLEAYTCPMCLTSREFESTFIQ